MKKTNIFLFLVMLLLISSLAIASNSDPGDGNGTDSDGGYGPEFSPLTALVATVGIFIIAFFIRMRLFS